MNYLIILPADDYSFFTNWYDYENNWIPDIGMIVVNVNANKITFDGINWTEIKQDEL